MIGDSKCINGIGLSNIDSLADWYGNRAKLAQKYGDVTEFHFLKSKELYYYCLANSIKSSLTQQQKVN